MVGRIRKQPEGISVTLQLLQCQVEERLGGDRCPVSGVGGLIWVICAKILGAPELLQNVEEKRQVFCWSHR